MFRKIVEALRVSAYFLVAFLIWAVWSAEPFFANRPSSFQAAGSIIVAWAIFFYGRDKLFHSNAISQANRDLSIAAHNSLQAQLEFSRSLSENTQNMNVLAHARLLQKLGLEDSNLGDNNQVIASLEETMNDQDNHFELGHKASNAQKYLEEMILFNENIENEQGKWSRIVYGAELGLVVFGTLQWGYGDKWTIAVHEVFPDLENWWVGLFA